MRSWIVALALACSSAALAQGTAPPTPDTPPPQSPAPQAEMSEMKSKVQSMYEDFRSFKERLPFRFGAGVYLFYYQPLDFTTFSPTDRNGYFQVYAFWLKLDKEVALAHGGTVGAHAEIRMRDGGHIGPGSSNQYLRGFFSSNIWFQELYAYYRPWSFLDIKAGKIYRKVGIFWDDSFFGNIQYFDGNKLVPDWGVSLEGHHDFLRGRLGLEYSAQYFYNGSGTNGSLDYGRTFGAPPETAGNVQAVRDYSPTAEGATDGTGNRMSELQHAVDARVAVTVRPARALWLTAGVSGFNGRVARAWKAGLTMMAQTDTSQFSQLAPELTIGGNIGPVAWRILGEYNHQYGPAMRDADYVLAGAKGSWNGLSAYLNCSYVRYSSFSPAVQEYIIQPGVTYTIGGGLAVLVEYDEWQRKDPRGVSFPLQGSNATMPVTGFYPIDRSLNVVLAYSY